ncbi:urea carboxylase [Thermobifida cellulosilytica]|uniref:Urea carboxylase n=1 Tax=Thermobifida cellulosilytica TB100 TaxID=665004 RepID=A0A147KIL4_THECS|nr:urea carboxylase [Thermobifida cellulosilytica]KUP97133.1 urea carboxylase [Thermobifida cellulosilytica TB100]
MFDTLLVANRGEIACRIIRTARRMGLRTVAVFSDADRAAAHVRMADRAVRLGPAPAAESYLRVDRILDAAAETGAGAVHPGYGFLSENADFARAVQDAGMVFVGPTPEQITVFGDKHTARTAARDAGVPLVPGSGLLTDVDEAVAAAEEIGYPVMVKATGGGGGIGMRVCADADELRAVLPGVVRTAEANFGVGGVFLERFVRRARHVEVQVFGDGAGRVVSLGDRDCTLQRRHQKVVEEAPAPNLPDEVREALHRGARELCASVGYRSAGTVEFVYDVERGEASFLEVNTRLQVEHPVTEAITGVDLVEWMLRLARGEDVLRGVADTGPAAYGHAVEARIYAEDPARDYQPSPGLLTRVEFPGSVRVDTWVETGDEVSTAYDPLLAKIVATGETRTEALDALGRALAETKLDGTATNLGLLRAVCDDDTVRAAGHTTDHLANISPVEARVDVLRPGTLTTVQDWPGRIGYWEVGVPPSGPMDDVSFRAGNLALGNPEGAPGLECTLNGPALKFGTEATVCVTGAPAPVTLDGEPVAQWEPIRVPAGSVLDVGPAEGPGVRTYVLVRGGLDVPRHLGSAATFPQGRLGGHGGRALAVGDVLRVADAAPDAPEPAPVPPESRPVMDREWQIAVSEGPQPAPEFLTRESMERFYAATWRVQHHAARTGVRLSGPKPQWARADGGEAGLHPSNLHDNPYSVGAVNFTGDTPILLGPDGPSLGGFVCPVTVVSAERWKIGQLRPGDSVRFVPVTEQVAEELRTARRPVARGFASGTDGDDGVLARIEETDTAPSVTYRRGGDDNILVEYGPMTLDLGLRMRVHALAGRLAEQGLHGLVDVTPGIRSLHLHTDPDVLPVRKLLAALREAEESLPPTSELVVPSREVHLPLSWDDPVVSEAISRYTAGVRDDAPWNPSNIEFMRRINGLSSVEEVRDTVFAAEYLVLGLGDVYLGAPAAAPLDPRHRLVTTKYNPARTWTAEGTVGIGGTYLCIYGMDSPGGYQLIGRTVPIWSGLRQHGPFEPGAPWLLRFFDRIVWHPVSPEELLDVRADFAAGRTGLDIRPGKFALAEYERFLADNAESIAEFQRRQAAAFAAEREAWAAAGEFDERPEPEPIQPKEVTAPAGGAVVAAPLAAGVWRVDVRPGQRVSAGETLLSLEAMKLETVVSAPVDGQVVDVLVTPGQQVDAGTALVVLAGQEVA